jgi:hypothetical protein
MAKVRARMAQVFRIYEEGVSQLRREFLKADFGKMQTGFPPRFVRFSGGGRLRVSKGGSQQPWRSRS